MDLIGLITADEQVRRLADALAGGQRAAAAGACGSSTSLLAGAIARLTGRPVVLIVAHTDDADEVRDELSGAAGKQGQDARAAGEGRDSRRLEATAPRMEGEEDSRRLEATAPGGGGVVHLPALEVLPGETNIDPELLARRLGTVRAVLELAEADAPVIVCPIQALMQAVPSRGRLDALLRVVEQGQTCDPVELVRWLDAAGYSRVDAIEEPGEFALRGGILDVFPPGDGGRGVGGGPVRLDFFGDEVDRISEIDLATMGSDRAIGRVELVCADPEVALRDEEGGEGGEGGDGEGGGTHGQDARATDDVNFLDLVPARAVAIVAETLEVTEQGRGYYERVTDARGIFGPPAVLKRLTRFHAVAEVNQYSSGATHAEARVELPVEQLPPFAREAPEAVAELVKAAEGMSVVVACQNEAEARRFGELLNEKIHAPPSPPSSPPNAQCPMPNAPDHGQDARATGRGRDSRRLEATAPREVKEGKTRRLEATAPGETGKGEIRSVVSYIHRGFVWGDGLMLVPYHELLHRYHARRAVRRLRGGRAMDTFLEFQVGDHVVHAEHGICRFAGLSLMAPRQPKRKGGAGGAGGAGKAGKVADAEKEEYLTLEFAGGAKLHVPARKIDQVQKYVGGFRGKPPLSTLGGVKWKHQKERVTESVRDLASELLRVRAAREHMPGVRYPEDTAWQREFEAEFPYEETEDQLASMISIKKDMVSDRPMDRLLCGDVGFGKTELAIRAAFKAVEFGKQVAVLVPTTVLAEQHERTFRERFADYPFRIESLSRFKTGKETGRLLDDLRDGRIDIIIGTHRLLSRDVAFADLGLIVVDEEQRFGVEHKQTLLSLRMTVDVLTLSATPIPRTLHMSMLGLRDISSLATAPPDRQSVVTEVIPYNEKRLSRAIARELSRGGQAFVVHNRVHNIRSVADEVRRLAPEARVIVGHGQMPARELERVMLTFMRREADILVSTTIIESGIDIPTANTMVIMDADRFGLAELHQLRGRVGRYKHRAYCYLLLPTDRTVRPTAVKRLRAIEQYSMLGAGFKIAMRDLEIRGAGNLLGPEQSGHIAAVGYEMYCQLLERAVHDLTSDAPPPTPSATSVEIGVSGVIPRPYIPSDARRLEAYRRIATASSVDELARVEADLVAAYGEAPPQVDRLLQLAEVRIGASALDVRTIVVRDNDLVFRTESPRRVAGCLEGAAGTVHVLAPRQEQRLSEVYYRPPRQYLEPGTLLNVLRRRLAVTSKSEAVA